MFTPAFTGKVEENIETVKRTWITDNKRYSIEDGSTLRLKRRHCFSRSCQTIPRLSVKVFPRETRSRKKNQSAKKSKRCTETIVSSNKQKRKVRTRKIQTYLLKCAVFHRQRWYYEKWYEFISTFEYVYVF